LDLRTEDAEGCVVEAFDHGNAHQDDDRREANRTERVDEPPDGPLHVNASTFSGSVRTSATRLGTTMPRRSAMRRRMSSRARYISSPRPPGDTMSKSTMPNPLASWLHPADR